MRHHSTLFLLLVLAAVPPLLPSHAIASWIRVRVSDAANEQVTTHAVPDGAGGAIIAWVDHRTGVPAIFAHRLRSTDNTDPAWTPNGVAITTQSTDGLALVSDGAGGAIVLYIVSPSYEVRAKHLLASGALDPAWPAAGVVLVSAVDERTGLRAIPDGAGGAFLTWYDWRDFLDNDADIYAHHVRANGTVDPAWPVNGRAVCTSLFDQLNPDIASDGAGGMIIVWEDERNGAEMNIFAQRLQGNSQVQTGWLNGGRLVCSNTEPQNNPRVVPDGASGAIVAWTDFRELELDVYALRIQASNGANALGWPVNGIPLCAVLGDQELTDLVADGAGGAVAVWQDQRNDGETDVYAARVTGGAATPWTAGGVAVCTAARSQALPRLVTDGAGGVCLAWQDHRGGPGLGDLFVQRLLLTGAVAPSWPANGVRLSSDGMMGLGQGHEPSVIASPNGAIVAWDHTVNGSPDVVAIHVAASGTPPAAVDPLNARATSVRVSPNPIRSAASFAVTLPDAQRVRIAVHDVQGRRVREVVDARWTAGTHQIGWDARDDHGRPIASGVYLVRFEIGGKTYVERVTAIR